MHRWVTVVEPRRFYVIVNPTSGRGAGARMPAFLEQAMSAKAASLEIRVTEGPGHATALAGEASLAGEPIVVAVGGDGTIHEVVNGLLRNRDRGPGDALLGIVPVGTGNDFVKVVEGAGTREDAVTTLVTGSPRRVDVGYAQWDGDSEYFVNAAGTGIDVEVVRLAAPRRGVGGALAYIVALLRSLGRYSPLPVRVEADGHHLEQRVMTVTVGNGRSVGGVFRICPGAEIDDGLLDVCSIRELSLLRSIGVAARILRGTHAGSAGVETFRASTVELSVPEGTPLFFQLDGELREPGGVHTLRMEVRPGMLQVLTRAAPR